MIIDISIIPFINILSIIIAIVGFWLFLKYFLFYQPLWYS